MNTSLVRRNDDWLSPVTEVMNSMFSALDDIGPWRSHYETQETTVVKEEDGQVSIEFELPRYKKEEVKVLVNDSSVVVDAQKGESLIRKSASISPIDVNTAKAVLADGVLTVTAQLLKPEPKYKEIIIG